MRATVALILTFVFLARSVPAAPQAPNIETKIASIPLGSRIEVRLTDKQKLRGIRGAASAESFVLSAPKADRTVAFAEVVSVKRIGKSHTTRNVLIIVAVAVVAVVITGVVLYENRGSYIKLR
jgi:hypothetical protein